MRSSGAPRAVSSRIGRFWLLLQAQRLGQVQAAFARHHHVQHHQVRVDRPQLRPRLGGIAGGGDTKAFAGQIARQALAQAGIVLDDQDVAIVGHARQASSADPVPSI